MGRIKLVQTNASALRDPLRQSLAEALERYAETTKALAEQAANMERAEEARWSTGALVDKATEALAAAKEQDALSLAAGRPGGAVKAARIELQTVEDAREAAVGAMDLLTKQRLDLDRSHGICQSRLDTAITEVVRSEAGKLLDRYEAARQAFHDIHGVLSILFSANALPRELEPAIQNIDIREIVHRDLPPSQTAIRVKTFIERLRTDVDAVPE